MVTSSKDRLALGFGTAGFFGALASNAARPAEILPRDLSLDLASAGFTVANLSALVDSRASKGQKVASAVGLSLSATFLGLGHLVATGYASELLISLGTVSNGLPSINYVFLNRPKTVK